MQDEKSWRVFLELCLEAKDASGLDELFNLFLTLEEKEHLSSRMQIIKALMEQKLSQREISEKMKVSISQITRGSNALKVISEDLLKFLKKHIREEKNDK